MTRSRSVTVALVGWAVLAAACLGPTSTGPAADGSRFAEAWWELAVEEPEGHDHTDPLHHADRSTPNFDILGYDPLETQHYGGTAGGYGCGDAASNEERTLSLVQAFGTDVAFVLTDVTDPSAPFVVGELVMPNANVYDVALTPDARYAVLGTSIFDSGPDTPQIGTPQPMAAPSAFWRDACSPTLAPVALPPQLVYNSGVVLVDLAHPSAPVITDFRPLPALGAHSIRAAQIDGQTLILATVANIAPGANYYVFLGIQDGAAGPGLEVLSVYSYDVEAGTSSGGSGNHDGYLAVHPITGEALAYLAYGGAGLIILNIDDPTDPVFVGRWNDWQGLGQAAAPGNYMHGVLPINTTWDGRHYTFVGEECGNHRQFTPSCLVMVLDTTDPGAPELVAVWTLPAEVTWLHSLQYSTHYFELVDRTLFVSMYHAGLWALDVSSPKALATLPAVGVFLPSHAPPNGPGDGHSSLLHQQVFGEGLRLAPLVLDINRLPDRSLAVYDINTGLYTVRFDAQDPAPAAPRWESLPDLE